MKIERNKLTYSQESWLDDLLSGNYKQTDNYLHIKKGGEDKFCCLGVACNRFHNAVHVTMKNPDEEAGGVTVHYGNNSEVLPFEMQAHLFLYGEIGNFLPGESTTFWNGNLCYGHDKGKLHECDTLASMNDRGITFEQIAVFIRQYPWAVFINFDKGDNELPAKLSWNGGKNEWEASE